MHTRVNGLRLSGSAMVLDSDASNVPPAVCCSGAGTLRTNRKPGRSGSTTWMYSPGEKCPKRSLFKIMSSFECLSVCTISVTLTAGVAIGAGTAKVGDGWGVAAAVSVERASIADPIFFFSI